MQEAADLLSGGNAFPSRRGISPQLFLRQKSRSLFSIGKRERHSRIVQIGLLWTCCFLPKARNSCLGWIGAICVKIRGMNLQLCRQTGSACEKAQDSLKEAGKIITPITSSAWIDSLIFPMKKREKHHADVYVRVIIRLFCSNLCPRTFVLSE